MPQPDVIASVVRFADFEVDLRSGELRKRGRRLRLQEQPLCVLGMLLERAGDVVTREELRQKLWPADTFVDFDHGLNSAVARLRESLNDSADEPRFVETIPKRGYRFIGDLKTSEPSPVPEINQVTVQETAPVPLKAPGPWKVIAGMVAVLILVGLRTSGFSSRVGEPSLPPPEIIPLAGLAGYEVGPAFSPDGNQVAFTEINGRQNSGIYTSLVGGEESLRLTHDRRDCCATWSPDGRNIAFLRQREDHFDIYLIPALGGTERRLYTIPHVFYPSLTWSPDGETLAFPQSTENSLSSRITLLSLADFRTRQLTVPSENYVDWGPAFSPDGSLLAFIRGTLAGVANDVYVVPVSGGEARRLTFNNRPTFGLDWAANGDLIYSLGRKGATGLWRVCSRGGTPSLVAGVGLMAYSPSISRKGNELAYQEAIGKDNIWRIAVNDGRGSAGPAIAVAAKGRKLRPSFSPDGKKIAFESDRLGSMEIWTCDQHGLNCAELTSLHGTAGTARWSPDGQTIAFEFHPGEHAEVYVVDVHGGPPRQVVTLPGADNLAPSWSRDGRWLYFSSKRSGEPFQLWKVPWPGGGAPVQITHTGGISAQESDDGRYLYFSKYEQRGVWRMPLQGGPEVRVHEKPDGADWFNWGLAKKGIYFLDAASEPKTKVEFYDFATGKTSEVWALDKPWGWGLSVSPDNQSVLFVQSEYEQSNIMVVKNFR